MKTSNVKAMGFGFSAINAGQRNAVVEPQVIVVSTEGGFRLTPPVSKALGVSHGDYVMFLSNIDQIDAAIAAKAPEVVSFCEENGFEVGSPEAAIALHKEFDRWAIAKGIVEYDTKGNQKTINERLTKNDKIKYVTQNFDDAYSHIMEIADEEIKEALTREGVTREEQISILSAFVKARELPKFKGSKAANPAGLTGTGVSLNFTDTNVWKQMKSDLGLDANKVNRVYNVDVEDLQKVEIYDGCKNVSVNALVLGEYVDKEPVRIMGKDVDDED